MKPLLKLLFATTLSAVASVAVAQQTYVNVNPPQPTDPDKIEVLEFFSYGCGHCAVIDPMVSEWRQTLSDNVSFKHVPVAFNAGMKPAQQLYYTLEAMGLEELHPKVFEAIHQDGERLFTEDAILNWVAKQGVDKAKFEATMKSFGVDSKMKRADQLVAGYGIQGTPSIAVGGRFVTSPAEAGGYQETLQVANELIRQVPAN